MKVMLTKMNPEKDSTSVESGGIYLHKPDQFCVLKVAIVSMDII